MPVMYRKLQKLLTTGISYLYSYWKFRPLKKTWIVIHHAILLMKICLLFDTSLVLRAYASDVRFSLIFFYESNQFLRNWCCNCFNWWLCQIPFLNVFNDQFWKIRIWQVRSWPQNHKILQNYKYAMCDVARFTNTIITTKESLESAGTSFIVYFSINLWYGDQTIVNKFHDFLPS